MTNSSSLSWYALMEPHPVLTPATRTQLLAPFPSGFEALPRSGHLKRPVAYRKKNGCRASEFPSGTSGFGGLDLEPTGEWTLENVDVAQNRISLNQDTAKYNLKPPKQGIHQQDWGFNQRKPTCQHLFRYAMLIHTQKQGFEWLNEGPIGCLFLFKRFFETKPSFCFTVFETLFENAQKHKWIQLVQQYFIKVGKQFCDHAMLSDIYKLLCV